MEDGPSFGGTFVGDDIDSDDNTNTLIYTIVQLPSEGEVTNLNNGTFTFDPQPDVDFQDLALDETRDVFFSYTATDRHGAVSDPAVVTITVTGVNDAPTADDMVVNVFEDGAPMTAMFAANDIDSDNDLTTLSYTFVSSPNEGFISDNGDGTFTFDPGPDFQDLGVGETRDVFVVYTATDRHGATSEEATITIRVDGVNDPPVAVDDPVLQSGYSTARGQVLTINNPGNGVLANDLDPDANDVIVVRDAPVTVTSTLGATVVINADGTFTYNPLTSNTLQQLPIGQSLNDTFPYTITDNKGGEDSAVVTIFVTGVNSPPVANPLLVFAMEDGPVITHSFPGNDPDGDDSQSTLVYAILPGTGPSEGAVSNNSNGTFSFNPRDDFQDLRPGEIRDVFFQYRATDRHGAVSNIGTITVRVEGVNDAPVAVDDPGILNQRNTSVIIAVLANDFDFDGSPFDLTSVEIVTSPANGRTAPNADGTITYTPNSNFVGMDTFTYRFRDDEGPDSLFSNVATVTISTTAFPVAGDTTVQTLRDTAVDVDILSLAADPDGTINPVSIVVVSPPVHGSVSIDLVSGILTYIPDPSFLGTDQLQYTVRDNVGATSAPGTITIDVVENLTPYRNPIDPLDVNGDGRVNAFDVLLIVSFLQEHGAGAPFGPTPPFLDVAAPDNFVSPFDALVIVSHLNSLLGMGEGGEEGEGEGTTSFTSFSPRGELPFEPAVAISGTAGALDLTPYEVGRVTPVGPARILTSEPSESRRKNPTEDSSELIIAAGGGEETEIELGREPQLGLEDALDEALVEDIARTLEPSRAGALADRALLALLYDSDYGVKRS